MRVFVNRYATPLTTGLFAVSAISGVALFVHLGQGVFHGMHELLSMLLLVPVGLHMWRNWSNSVSYAKRGTLLWPLVSCLVVAMPFAVSGMMASGRSGNPAFRIISVMTRARIGDLAPVLGTTPAALVAELRQGGYRVGSTEQTLDAAAAASGKSADQLLFAVMPRT